MTTRPERFRSTGSLVMGWLGLVLVGGVVAIGVLDRSSGLPLWAVFAALLFGVLLWASMVRPVVEAVGDDLVLRNMFDTVSVPLAAVEQVAIGQLLAVGTADARYVSPAVGRSWRTTARRSRAEKAGKADDGTAYADHVEQRLSQLAEDARARQGVRLMSEEQAVLAGQVRREVARVELAALALAVLGLVVSALL